MQGVEEGRWPSDGVMERGGGDGGARGCVGVGGVREGGLEGERMPLLEVKRDVPGRAADDDDEEDTGKRKAETPLLWWWFRASKAPSRGTKRQRIVLAIAVAVRSAGALEWGWGGLLALMLSSVRDGALLG